ncbi:MAG: Chromosome partitioning protein ParB family [Parcubacteria group bacterium]|nr:Chromosome partitioning protein ParB family [Parcubacteria group bacterium]
MKDETYIPTKYDSVFWVEIDRIKPNPYQPRIEFNEENLKSLAESIRQYGVLMPLVVTRKDIEKADGGLQTAYELIAGERRLRASKLIGLREVPVVIRAGEQTDRMKLELAIIENLQREDLNSIDRAKALAQLAETFGITHGEIGVKIGRSREYVSNSIRLLQLPEEVQNAVVNKEITEGHARALLMLTDRPEERDTLFKEIVLKKTSVRVVEQMARRLAQDKIRKHDKTPEMMDLERSLTETLGTRVLIENRPKGGRVLIEFFSPEDLSHIAAILAERHEEQARMSPEANAAVAEVISGDFLAPSEPPEFAPGSEEVLAHPNTTPISDAVNSESGDVPQAPTPAAAPTPAEPEEDLYSVHNFTV